MSDVSAQIKEWKDLSKRERNSLMWPDLIRCIEKPNKVIRRDNPDDSLGLVTVAVQGTQRNTWYNVVKYTKQDYPVYGFVKQYDWIDKVDGVSTTDCPNEMFTNLIKNGKNEVHLSLKRAVNPLTEFVKKWGREKRVTLHLKDKEIFRNRVRLVHFYCKEEDTTHDRILVWEVKPGRDAAMSNELPRGDEVVSVNGQAVEGKRLAEVYKLIHGDDAVAVVNLTIKEIQHDTTTSEEERQANVTSMEHVVEEPQNSPAASQPRADDADSRTPTQESETPRNKERQGQEKDSLTPKHKMYQNCRNESQLPDDRNEWRVHKIEHGCFQKICDLLDIKLSNKFPLLVTLGCFTNDEAELLKQQFHPTGKGLANAAIRQWGNYRPENNIGQFKKIISRIDVLEEIAKWEIMSVCHGCGVKLTETPA